MARRRKSYTSSRRTYNPLELALDKDMDYFSHYSMYLRNIAFQMFEWKNLPDSVDPRFLEMSLHQLGYVAFYKDPKLGYIVTQGALSGTIDHYNLNKSFQATAPSYQAHFDLYNYPDMKPEKDEPNQGVVIFNNDMHTGTFASLNMFASDLAETKEIIQINQNAQKTPFMLTGSDATIFSIKNIFQQIDGNAPVIATNEKFDMSNLKVLNLNAPYVIDKLNQHKNAIWNEAMTFLGIKNANLEKKERMVTSEVESNNEQIDSSGNIFLKARQEACKRINDLYDLELSVAFREGVNTDEPDNTIQTDNRASITKTNEPKS